MSEQHCYSGGEDDFTCYRASYFGEVDYTWYISYIGLHPESDDYFYGFFYMVIYLDTDYDSADVYYGYLDYCEFIFKTFFWIRIFFFILHVITCLGQDLRNFLMV